MGEGPKPDIKTPKAEVSVQAPIGELDVGTNLSTDLEGSESAIVTANKDKTTFKGPSCLQGEKPDPHLKLQGPKAEVALEGPDTSASIRGNEMTADAPSPGVKGKKFEGPSCLRGEKPDPHLLKLQGPKIDGHGELEKDILPAKVPTVDAEAKLSITEPEAQKTKKHKGISCLQGEKPDPHLLKLQGPKADIDTLEPSANLSAKVEMPALSAPRDSSMPTIEGAADTDIVIQPKKSKFKGPSCLQGEKPDPYLLRLQGPKADLGGPEVEPIKGKASVDFTTPELNVLVEKPKLDSIKARNDEAPATSTNLETKQTKGKGFSCLEGEKPDPHLLKLRGPRIDKSLKRPKNEADIAVSAKSPKIDLPVEAESEADVSLPNTDMSLPPEKISMSVESAADLSSKKDKPKSTSCWKGSESPDPYLLRLKGPKVPEVKTGSLKTDLQHKPLSSDKGSSLPAKLETEKLEASEVQIKVGKKQRGPSCLKGEVDEPIEAYIAAGVTHTSKDLTLEKRSETKKFKIPKFHISSDVQESPNQATLTPVLGPEGRTTFAIMESPDIDFVTPKLQVTPKLPKASLSLNKEDEKEAGPTNTSSGFNFKGFHMKKSTHVAQSDQPSKRSPFKMPKVSITAKKKQSYSVSAFPDVDVQFPYIDSSEPQVSVEAPGTPPHLTLQAMRRLGSTGDENEEMRGSKTLPTSRRGQRESVTTSWPKIRSSGGSLGDDVDSAGASPESTLKPRSPSLHGSNVSIMYYFVDTPFSATEIEIPDVSADPHSQLKLTETSSGIIVMETTHTSVSPHGGDSSALDVDASFSTDSLPLESHHQFQVDSSQQILDDSEHPPSTTPSPFSTLPAGVSPQHVTVSATNLLQSSHTYKEETIEIDSKTSVSVMAAMGDTEAIKPSASSAVKVSETESDELLDSIKQELEWTT